MMNTRVWFKALFIRGLGVVLAVMGLVVGATAQSADVSKGGQLAGTCELIICKSACSFSKPANAFATVVVVLFGRVMTQREVDRIVPFSHYDPHEINACFEFKRRADAQSYAAINVDANGVSPWSLGDHTIQFELYHGPDSGYVVEIERTGDVVAVQVRPGEPGWGHLRRNLLLTRLLADAWGLQKSPHARHAINLRLHRAA